MRFFHIGDLHFGKTLYNIPLAESDQPWWVDRFLEAVDNWAVDAVVIAGDVYDRRVPPPEALKLFDHLLTELAGRGKYVFVIPGNHDSSVRLAHVNDLLSSHRIYIAGELTKELPHVTIPGKTPGEQDVVFWMMPYVFPKAVSDRKVLDREDIGTYDEAVRELLAVQNIDRGKCNILAAHQNVLANGVAPDHSESETIVGGLGEIEVSAFDEFDYVALGHIHNAQKIGRECVRYSGCPLYYDFSEIGRKKDLTLVTVRPGKKIEVQTVEIPLLHQMLEFSGTLDELLEQGQNLQDKDHYYVQCILKGRHVPPRALEKLRDVYGNCLVHVKREPDEFRTGGFTAADNGENSGISGNTTGEEGIAYSEDTALSLGKQFGVFFREQEDTLLDDIQEKLVMSILEQQSRRGEDYYQDAKSIPEQESEELIDLLQKELQETEERENRAEAGSPDLLQKECRETEEKENRVETGSPDLLLKELRVTEEREKRVETENSDYRKDEGGRE